MNPLGACASVCQREGTSCGAIHRDETLPELFLDQTQVRAFIGAFNLGVCDLAKLMGCSHTYLIRVLKGERHISRMYAVKLVEALEKIARETRLDSSFFLRYAHAVPLPSPVASQPIEPPKDFAVA